MTVPTPEAILVDPMSPELRESLDAMHAAFLQTTKVARQAKTVSEDEPAGASLSRRFAFSRSRL
jgi:hypothetical protein